MSDHRTKHWALAGIGLAISAMWIVLMMLPAPYWLRVMQMAMLSLSACTAGVNLYLANRRQR